MLGFESYERLGQRVHAHFPPLRRNQAKSVARFCPQVAEWVPDMFQNFYLVKNHKIAHNSTAVEAR
jgi:hypothetical protein